jgi:hypothetical protein
VSFIRGRQRVVTALFPHNGNRRFIVPGRKPPAPPGIPVQTAGDFEVTSFDFDGQAIEALSVRARNGDLLPAMIQKERWQIRRGPSIVATQSLYVHDLTQLFLNVNDDDIQRGDALVVTFQGSDGTLRWEVVA